MSSTQAQERHGRADDPLMVAIEALKKENAELKRPRQILFCDDDEGMRMLFQRLANGFNCEVTYAPGGEEAVKLACRYPFDLIMLDINMPGMDGIEAFKQIRTAIGDRTPVTFFTGRLDYMQALEIGRIGFAAFIQKPEQFKPDYIASMFHTFGINDREPDRA